MQDDTKLSLLQAAIAGFTATGPMTVFMLLAQQFLPPRQQYALSPELIMQQLLEKTPIKASGNKKLLLTIALLAHFGYGATMGTLYKPVAEKSSLDMAIKSALFSLLVWGTSYLVWLPLAGISESGWKQPLHRNLMMIAAHLVWGVTMGKIIYGLTHHILSGDNR